MKTSIRFLIVHIALLISCVSAFAATATHTFTTFPTRTNWGVTNGIPQWNPADGTLNGVVVSIAGNVSSQYRVENRDTVAATVTATTDANVTAEVGSTTVSAAIAPTHTQTMTEFDSIIDYAGTSGFTVTSVATGSDIESASVLTPFIGTGVIPITVNSTASASIEGLGYYRFIVNTFSSAVVTVTYDFTPNCPEAIQTPTTDDCDSGRHKKSRGQRR